MRPARTLGAVLSIVAFVLAVASPNPARAETEPAESTAAEAQPLSQAELMRAMEAYRIDLPAAAREALEKELDKRLQEIEGDTPELRARYEEIRGLLKNTEEAVPLMSVLTLIDRDAEAEDASELFVGCDDPLLRLVLELTAVKRGDRDAADRLHALFHSNAPTDHQNRLLKTYSLALGLRVQQDTPQDLFDYIVTAANHDKPKVPVGAAAPDFVASTVSGERIELADFRGKVVLIHFWSTWCGPCMAGMEGLKEDIERASANSPDDVVVVSVSLDFDRAEFDKATQEKRPPGRNVYDGAGWGGDLARAYGVNHLPYDFVISPSGEVVSNTTDGLEVALAELLVGRQGEKTADPETED